MKKIALLVIGLVLVFSLSAVYATEEEQPTLISAPVEESGNSAITETTKVTEISGEETSVEESETAVKEAISGEENVSGSNEATEQDHSHEKEDASSNSSNDSSAVGAIIAIVIVVAVVAIAAILRKD